MITLVLVCVKALWQHMPQIALLDARTFGKVNTNYIPAKVIALITAAVQELLDCIHALALLHNADMLGFVSYQDAVYHLECRAVSLLHTAIFLLERIARSTLLDPA